MKACCLDFTQIIFAFNHFDCLLWYGRGNDKLSVQAESLPGISGTCVSDHHNVIK